MFSLYWFVYRQGRRHINCFRKGMPTHLAPTCSIDNVRQIYEFIARMYFRNRFCGNALPVADKEGVVSGSTQYPAGIGDFIYFTNAVPKYTAYTLKSAVAKIRSVGMPFSIALFLKSKRL